MKIRRFLALALAFTMVMGLSMTALADPMTAAGEQDIEVTVTTEVPVISVTVPTTATVKLNPYRLDVTVDGETVTDQVISAPMVVTNGSNVPIIVSYTAKAEAAGEVVIVATAPKATDTAKSAYLFVKAGAGAAPDAITYDKNDSLVLSTKDQTKAAAFELAKKNGDDPTPGYLAIGGNLSTQSAKDWVAADKVNVSLKFSFIVKANTVAEP